MLIYAGGDETLLSDSTRLAEKAKKAGVDVTLKKEGVRLIVNLTAIGLYGKACAHLLLTMLNQFWDGPP